MVGNVGVHATHCCPKCGCKYSEYDCPVYTGKVEPVYPDNNGCEFCEEDDAPYRAIQLVRDLEELAEQYTDPRVFGIFARMALDGRHNG